MRREFRKITLYSRCDRTYGLFRKNWIAAAENTGFLVKIRNRNHGLKNFLKAVFNFVFDFNSARVVFGTAEILIYIPFARKSDILVLTGLGRLFTYNGILNWFVKKFFVFFYRGQTVVLLNNDDKYLIDDLLKTNSIVLHGEGYDFNISVSDRYGLTSPPMLRIGYLGRLIKSKGVDVLLGCLLSSSFKGYTLTMFGINARSNPAQRKK